VDAVLRTFVPNVIVPLKLPTTARAPLFVAATATGIWSLPATGSSSPMSTAHLMAPVLSYLATYMSAPPVEVRLKPPPKLTAVSE